MKTYSIFGAGASGLYTAWRLLSGEQKKKAHPSHPIESGDVLELYDWGKYNFSKKHSGSREAAGRICTYHFDGDPANSYVEMGGMRYSYWDGGDDSAGHRLVTTTIQKLGLDKDSVPFDESDNPLYYLRTRNMYLSDISSNNPAPYNADNYAASSAPDDGFNVVEQLAVTEEMTRQQWCDFYQTGRINVNTAPGSVFQKGDLLKDIGYWNLMYDQLGSEGYAYTADGNGYSSNVINWNSAEALNANNEFTPGTEYKTLTHGFSSLFSALFQEIEKLAKAKGVHFHYHPDVRVRSILGKGDRVHFTTATRANPNKTAESKTCDFAWLAMPRSALERVAEATKYEDTDGLDVLNAEKVKLFTESAIVQPSYKIGMFFSSEWWKEGTATYPAQLTSFDLTDAVIADLLENGFSKKVIENIYKYDKKQVKKGEAGIVGTPYSSADDFLAEIEYANKARLSLQQEQQLLAGAERDTIGPSVTDLPIRQVVYFGNNAPKKKAKEDGVYGILASYDDEQFASFWKELELSPNTVRKRPLSEDMQPLEGPRKAPVAMVNMLRKQLANVHFGPQAPYSTVPEPLETVFMDWSLPPFNAGYHAYAAHYNLCEVQQGMRKPSQLIEGQDANIFIVGETYSNDQAWVEGAFCTAESVLNDLIGIKPIIKEDNYPFICKKCAEPEA